MTIQIRRILALLLDGLIIGFIITIFSSFIELKDPKNTVEVFNTQFIYGYSYVFLFYLGYFIFFDLIANSVTLGKSVFKLKLNFDKKKNIIFSRILRSIVKVLGIMLFPISIILFLVTKKAIHDFIVTSKHVKS